MDILYLLIPMSAVLVLCILGVFAWAMHAGQFDDLEREAERIFTEESPAVDPDQTSHRVAAEKSPAERPHI